jgi:hypothetical protein
MLKINISFLGDENDFIYEIDLYVRQNEDIEKKKLIKDNITYVLEIFDGIKSIKIKETDVLLI